MIFHRFLKKEKNILTNIIEIQNLYFLNILKNISFAVNEGDILGIIGYSNSGKTVLLKLIATLLNPSKGNINIFGNDVLKLKEQELNNLRKKTGFVFETGGLLDNFTVLENIGFRVLNEINKHKENITKILNEVDLFDIENKYYYELSGGMQRRVSIAKALFNKNELIIYDNPTAGLDVVNCNKIFNIIKKYNKTSIIVSNDLKNLFKICNKVIFIDNGEIIFNGNVEQINTFNNEIVQSFIKGGF